MRIFVALSFFLASGLCTGQLRSVVINSATNEGVPFVNIWIENENVGTTSNQNGEFELDVDGEKMIVFSAIGFETRKVPSQSITDTVILTQKINLLDEVIVQSNKGNEKLVLGKFKKSRINHYFSCGTKPWITARRYEFEEEYLKTPFLNKLKILTRSDIKDAQFNIRLYGIGKEGEPSGFIYDENIIGLAKKSKKVTEVDLSDLNIRFPEDGFFIAVEWLIIDSNIHEYTYTIEDTQEERKGISYEPSIGTIPVDTNEESWMYTQGKWKKIFPFYNPVNNDNDGKYSLLAIELTLTN